MATMSEVTKRAAASATGLILFTLASGQFLMTLDSSAMKSLLPRCRHLPRPRRRPNVVVALRIAQFR
jgi:hypothetical protein